MVADGDTEIVAPVPIGAPFPHPPSYHVQTSPVPKLPPTTLSVVPHPGHTAAGEAVALVGATPPGCTVTTEAC